ncbi:hypothetical protein C8Q77DRAFT_1073641 [Trametes polyzona]|nr:hypothetical protein C8Q77DRAFT_1073641 [Trametes polyzona]
MNAAFAMAPPPQPHRVLDFTTVSGQNKPGYSPNYPTMYSAIQHADRLKFPRQDMGEINRHETIRFLIRWQGYEVHFAEMRTRKLDGKGYSVAGLLQCIAHEYWYFFKGTDEYVPVRLRGVPARALPREMYDLKAIYIKGLNWLYGNVFEADIEIVNFAV